MGIKVTVKTKFRVNGKEYGSLEELPANVREAYERAMAAKGSDPMAGVAPSSGRVTFNGKEYDSVDEMPAEERHMYDGIMAAVESGTGASSLETPIAAANAGSAAPIVPGGSAGAGRRWLWVAIGFLALLAGLLLLLRAMAAR